MASRALAIEVRFKAAPGAQQVDTTAVNQVVNGSGVRRDLRRRAENVMAYQKANVGVKSGKLRDSIRIEERGGNQHGRASVQVIAGREGQTPQLGYQRAGTRSHTIRPRRGKWLAFYWARVGSNVVLRQVSHPGTAKNDFVIESTRMWRP